MILSFSDFLSDNAVIIILILLGAILGTAYLLKRKVFSKYINPDDEINQTPEEILQEELDQILVTERYNPNAKKQKDILDEEDDDEEVVEEEKKEENQQTDDFVVNTNTSYSFSVYDDDEDDDEE